LVGQTVLNYRIGSLLAEGGMGAVYVGEHALLGRRVAVKVLRPELIDDERAIARFVNEARAANAIRHPHIVELLDAGTSEQGRPYLVMELLEGVSLSARIDLQGRIGIKQALTIAQQAADALGAAHGAGIIHRDLTPDNLFLAVDPSRADGERVKLLDFGIAKLHEASPDTIHTSTGAVVGTPPYMSPEQCRGRSSEIDHRTDVYALGVILFEMVCGSPPFSAEGVGEVLLLHMTEPPPSPRSINPDVPEEVSAVILKALAKDKRDRWSTMAELQAALAACMPAEPAGVTVAQALAELAAPEVAVAPAPTVARARADHHAVLDDRDAGRDPPAHVAAAHALGGAGGRGRAGPRRGDAGHPAQPQPQRAAARVRGATRDLRVRRDTVARTRDPAFHAGRHTPAPGGDWHVRRAAGAWVAAGARSRRRDLPHHDRFEAVGSGLDRRPQHR
jgi:tRNA A-37 threonylcarbamoyl transferase component Bud32